MQRLGQLQRGDVPGSRAGFQYLAIGRIDQQRLGQARGQRRVAAEDHRDVLRRGAQCAGVGNHRHRHVRRRSQHAIDRSLQGAISGRRITGIGGQQYPRFTGLQCGDLFGLPGLEDQVRPGIDHSGEAHRQGPHQGDDAEQVVQVQPAGARRAFLTHLAEAQLAHEGRVEHHAGDDRHHKQQPHEAEKQLAGEPRVEVHVQAVHHAHEAFVEVRRAEYLGGAGIGEDQRRFAFIGVDAGIELDVPDVRRVFLGEEVQRHQTGVGLHSFGRNPVDRSARRALGHRRRLDLVAAEVIDLVGEDQRQAGQAQHQDEQRADEAGPLVNPAPPPQGDCLHQKSTVALTESVRGAPRTR